MIRLMAILLLSTAAPALAAEPFEDQLAAFDQSDAAKPWPADAVLFVGSSSVQRWDVVADDLKVPVVNRGVWGSGAADWVRFGPRVLGDHRPRIILYYAGDNDLAAGRSPYEVLAAFKSFVTMARQRLPQVPIVFISIKPSPARWTLANKIRTTNRIVRDYEKSEKGFEFVDVLTPMLDETGVPRKGLFQEDGLHLTRDGYLLWAQLLRPVVLPR